MSIENAVYNNQHLNNLLILNSAHGQWIPHMFAEDYEQEIRQQLGDEWAESLLNKDEYYWESWDDVLNSIEIERDGVTYIPIQDEDLFLVDINDAEQWTYI